MKKTFLIFGGSYILFCIYLLLSIVFGILPDYITLKSNANDFTANKHAICEIRNIVNSNDVQVTIASKNNFDTKKDLLLSKDLTPDGLLAICANPIPMNIENNQVQKWFQDAFDRVNLSEEQQMLIVKLKLTPYDKMLLKSSNLKVNTIVEICNTYKQLKKNHTIKNSLKKAIKGANLNSEHKLQIAQSSVDGLGLYW